LKYKSVRIPTIFSACLGCLLTVLFYGPVLIIEQIGFNPLLNQGIISFSEFITYPISFLIITKIVRKNSGIIAFIICGLTTGILIFIKIPTDCNLCSVQYIQLSLICFFRFILCSWYTVFMLYSV
jgi:hypothetical protein